MNENNKIAVCVSVSESGKVSSVLSSLGYECVGFKPDSMSLIRTVITDIPCAVIADTERIAREELAKAFTVLEGECRPLCIVLGESEDSPLADLGKIYCLSALPEPYTLKCLISGSMTGVGVRENISPEPMPETLLQPLMEDGITKIIRKIGIPANIKGYRYIRTAIMLVINDPSLLESVTKELYPEIARLHDATPARVERAIRHAITVAWDRAEGDEEYLSKRLHCRIDFSGARPTNSELIALISDSLMLEARGKKAEHFILSV
ncbi:MAG: sporulation initiation factor Spo0A C-terminal domain-containing protein [Oscillospiraceae bacterium]|nr:sporulation initiation factor Spo0A C-terminal domain-containing protein [Oscillospiraceae bacterium]